MSSACCCCLIAVADDGVTPFAQRADFESLSGGGYRWIPEEPFASTSGLLIRTEMGGGGTLDGHAMTLRAIESDVPQASFRISIWDGFVYLATVPIAYLPALAEGTPASVELGFGWASLRGPTAVVWVRAWNASGTMLHDAVIPMPLLHPYLSWRLDAVEMPEATVRVSISHIGGPDHPTCRRPPPLRCESFEYDGRGGLTWLVRAIPMRSPSLSEAGSISRMVRSRAIVRTTAGASLTAIFGFGDCCAGNRFEISFEANVARAYVRFMCAHGGPQTLASIDFTGGLFQDTQEPRDYELSVCIRQQIIRDAYENYFYRTVASVTVNDSRGLSFHGTAEGAWGIIADHRCVFGGLADGLLDYSAGVQIVDAILASSGSVVEASLDACPCRVHPGEGVYAACLDEVCAGGYYPPEREPPATLPRWRLSLSLPDEFSFANDPSPAESGQCFGDVTTEATYAEVRNDDPGYDPWLRTASDAYLAERFGLPSPSGELYCCAGRWCDLLGAPNQGGVALYMEASVWRPLRYLDTYTWAGMIPLFIVLTLGRRVRTTHEQSSVICMIYRRALLAASSVYPNCTAPITFSVRGQEDGTRTCYQYPTGVELQCDACDAQPMIDMADASAALIPE